MIKPLAAIAATAFLTLPAMAEIRWCPIDKAYYDTNTGLIVSRPSRPASPVRSRQRVKEKASYSWNQQVNY